MSTAYNGVHDFYRAVLDILHEAKIDILIGGAFAHEYFTGITRDTKDLDLFLRERDLQRAFNQLGAAGYRPEIKFSHWLGKVHDQSGAQFVDIIYNSGNGLCKVDDIWFDNAPSGSALGRPVKFCPLEETIWQKSFIMERERYDGADIAHLLHAQGQSLNWQRLLRRFDGHWRVLLSCLALYGYIYPTERTRIPEWVQRKLLDLWEREIGQDVPGPPICAGTFLSRTQFQIDVDSWGYRDARIPELMTVEEVEQWTKGADEDKARE
jgi:hypothetical protein